MAPKRKEVPLPAAHQSLEIIKFATFVSKLGRLWFKQEVLLLGSESMAYHASTSLSPARHRTAIHQNGKIFVSQKTRTHLSNEHGAVAQHNEIRYTRRLPRIKVVYAISMSKLMKIGIGVLSWFEFGNSFLAVNTYLRGQPRCAFVDSFKRGNLTLSPVTLPHEVSER
jgi:hypothetical protein